LYNTKQIKIGHGIGFSVQHVGTAHLSTPNFNFVLLDVLHVPNICKNLISVQKFTQDTNTFFELHPSHFLLKDRATGKLLLHRPSNHGFYPISYSVNKSHAPSALVGERASTSQWHSRLGHPALKIVCRVLSAFHLPVSSNNGSYSCSTCLGSKSKQLAFSVSTIRSNCPIELIFSDVWGLAPVFSKNGFKYYVSFIDDFSRYSWICHISCKSDVSAVFIKF
jgi:hypothetical protein